ncbi:DNA polymerase III subunit beta [Rhizobium bangladeshense]|uniref:DNA polymerase III subunit beta n=1 Tax=Rhizobium bangladeshense TaxID=1138189 RepID=UPI001C82FB40|nr:DNA polymerase III subunit beta [Rhizobium bangladeshense]MBX4884009.1 DNA polymerase III subunit beta [Rhizobium bangladeshense]
MQSDNVVQLFTTENPSALVDRAEMTECTALLAKLCGGKSSIPVLSHIRIASEPGGVALTATNLDIQAETSIAADVDARFSAALPAAALLKLMKKGTPSTTTILELLADEADSNAERTVASKCAIQLASSRFVLDAMPTDDFPDLIRHAEGDKVHRFTVGSAILWNALDGTIDAVSTDPTRYYLNGVYIHTHNSRLRFVSTDGHRLYIQDTNIQTGKHEIGAILPTEAAKFVANLLDGHAGADPVKVEISKGVAVFIFRDVAVTAKLIDGTFPDYQRVIPAEPDKTATIAGGELSARVTSLVDCTGATTVHLKFEGEQLAISATGPAGQGTTGMRCDYRGEELEIAFDAAYLRSAIEAASPDSRNMRIRMADSLSPALVTGSIGGWTGVLMPTKA